MEVLLICKTPLTTSSPSWPLRGSILGWFGDQRSWRQSAWTWIPIAFLENSFSVLNGDHQKDSIQSVQFSHSVMSNSLWLHGLQHARLPCPSPTPRVYSNSCPLSRWCQPTISFSVVPFSYYLQSFTASGTFQMSQFFASGGQTIGVSALASVLPMNIQNWFPLGWTGWISLQSKVLSRVFSNTIVQKHQIFSTQLSL